MFLAFITLFSILDVLVVTAVVWDQGIDGDLLGDIPFPTPEPAYFIRNDMIGSVPSVPIDPGRSLLKSGLLEHRQTCTNPRATFCTGWGCCLGACCGGGCCTDAGATCCNNGQSCCLAGTTCCGTSCCAQGFVCQVSSCVNPALSLQSVLSRSSTSVRGQQSRTSTASVASVSSLSVESVASVASASAQAAAAASSAAALSQSIQSVQSLASLSIASLSSLSVASVSTDFALSSASVASVASVFNNQTRGSVDPNTVHTVQVLPSDSRIVYSPQDAWIDTATQSGSGSCTNGTKVTSTAKAQFSFIFSGSDVYLYIVPSSAGGSYNVQIDGEPATTSDGQLAQDASANQCLVAKVFFKEGMEDKPHNIIVKNGDGIIGRPAGTLEFSGITYTGKGAWGSPTTKSSDNKAAVLGGAIGGAIAAVAIFIFAIAFYLRKRKQRSSPGEYPLSPTMEPMFQQSQQISSATSPPTQSPYTSGYFGMGGIHNPADPASPGYPSGVGRVTSIGNVSQLGNTPTWNYQQHQTYDPYGRPYSEAMAPLNTSTWVERPPIAPNMSNARSSAAFSPQYLQQQYQPPYQEQQQPYQYQHQGQEQAHQQQHQQLRHQQLQLEQKYDLRTASPSTIGGIGAAAATLYATDDQEPLSTSTTPAPEKRAPEPEKGSHSKQI